MVYISANHFEITLQNLMSLEKFCKELESDQRVHVFNATVRTLILVTRQNVDPDEKKTTE